MSSLGPHQYAPRNPASYDHTENCSSLWQVQKRRNYKYDTVAQNGRHEENNAASTILLDHLRTTRHLLLLDLACNLRAAQPETRAFVCE